MIDLTAWTVKLYEECLALDRQVFDSSEAWRSAEAPSRSPVAYVGPFRDTLFRERQDTSHVVTEIDALVSLMIVVPEVVEKDTGIANMGDLQIIRKAIAQVLIGWKPKDCVQPITFDGGEMVNYVTGKQQWVDRYSTRYLLVTGPDVEPVLLKKITTIDNLNENILEKIGDTVTNEESVK